MKKMVKVAILSLIAIMLATTLVSATTSAGLAEELYSMAKGYGVTEADKVKVERYLSENPVTDAQADKIVEKAQAVLDLAKNEGVTDLTKLSVESKQKAIALANDAAAELGVTLDFTGTTVKVYKDGKLLETISSNNGKLAYTGTESNVVLAVSAVVVLALATFIVAKRKNS